MAPMEKAAFNAALRQDLGAFAAKVFHEVTGGKPLHQNWHIGAMANALQSLGPNGTRRLLITIPPRHLKSTLVSVAFPTWQLGHDPSQRIICASYGKDLAGRLSHDSAKVMRSAWYRDAFPATSLSKDTEMDLRTTKNGYRYPTSIQGSLTGIGGSVIIVDDPMKADDALSQTSRDAVIEWFTNTLFSRLDNKAEDAIVVTMQRLHRNDLVGFLLEQGGWEHLCIPAENALTRYYRLGPLPEDQHEYVAGQVIDPVRESKEVLEQIRRQMGSKAYAAQYLQDPLPDGECLFDWAWFKTYDLSNSPAPDFVFQSWDVASSMSPQANFSVCTTWHVVGTDKFYLIDVHRIRLNHPDLTRRAHDLFIKHEPDIVLVESTGIGNALYQTLAKQIGNRVKNAMAIKDKIVRAEKQTCVVEQGQVFLPISANWLEEFRREITAFPQGQYDDQVDSMVQFLTYTQELMYQANVLGRRHHTGNEIKIQAPGFIVNAYQIGPRRLVSYS